MTPHQKRELTRIIIAVSLYVIILLLPIDSWLPQPQALYLEFALFLVPYFIAGWDVLAKAARGIGRGQVLDENFLMSIATIGAFALVFFPETEPHMAEGAAVMIFFQIGEFFEDYAVNRSRKSIAQLMDIAPEFANLLASDGSSAQVDPDEVEPGQLILVRPGERVPLDGVVENGVSQLDTSALTGESLPREVAPGSDVISGCINLSGLLTVRVTKPYGESTVQRILTLVEDASERKAKSEAFITKFARYYTPIVVGSAVLLAVVPPLLGLGAWGDWVQRGLIFLVVSCPCALVISVPLSFFGGIGGASRQGILVKGGNYLEALAHCDTVVMDKTGTLSTGRFSVLEVVPTTDALDERELLRLAAHTEAFSTHPIAASVRAAYENTIPGLSEMGSSLEDRSAKTPSPAARSASTIDPALVSDVRETAGQGVSANVDGHRVLAGNEKLVSAELSQQQGVERYPSERPLLLRSDDSSSSGPHPESPSGYAGTVIHVAVDGAYAGNLVIGDSLKADSPAAIQQLTAAGVRTVMLTGDREDVAAAVASELGINAYRAQLLPQDKVAAVEELLSARGAGKGTLAFVGDGINDAPALMRADVGIAMGAVGSDAAIEAADVVLMDDAPSKIALAIRIAKRTMRIVWQNIIFALGVKIAILILAALGIATLWLAVFGDVGVAVIAILNAMRALRVERA
ncbi:MAG: heavy metal translocating P-type ATPase [Coriobacteriales bacterium]|nr:heavy metal translocating P-type ATPase [Coriobacteriales bacterium]